MRAALIVAVSRLKWTICVAAAAGALLLSGTTVAAPSPPPLKVGGLPVT